MSYRPNPAHRSQHCIPTGNCPTPRQRLSLPQHTLSLLGRWSIGSTLSDLETRYTCPPAWHIGRMRPLLYNSLHCISMGSLRSTIQPCRRTSHQWRTCSYTAHTPLARQSSCSNQCCTVNRTWKPQNSFPVRRHNRRMRHLWCLSHRRRSCPVLGLFHKMLCLLVQNQCKRCMYEWLNRRGMSGIGHLHTTFETSGLGRNCTDQRHRSNQRDTRCTWFGLSTVWCTGASTVHRRYPRMIDTASS
jgi:hypothetical protein